MKKLLLLVCILSVSSLSFGGAIVYTWTNAGGDNLWATAANWDRSAIPGSSGTLDNPYFGSDAYCIIDRDVTAGLGLSPVWVTKIADFDNGGTSSHLKITSSGVLNTNNNVLIGSKTWAGALLEVEAGGYMKVALLTSISHYAGDGSVASNAGGTLLVAGTYETGSFQMFSNGVVDVTGSGVLIVAGDVTGTLQGYATSGWIKGDGIGGNVNIVAAFDPGAGITKTYVTVVPEPATALLLGLGSLIFVQRKK